jgi:P4 family phage/plasmid primase-like protien
MSSNNPRLSDDDKANINKFLEFMTAKYLKRDEKTGKYSKRVTHTLMGKLHESRPYRGCFHISGKDYDRFIKMYKSVYGKIPLHIVERPNETGKMVGPFIVDIDYKTKSNERLYTNNHIESIINICNDLFVKYLDIDEGKLKAYVLEKDEPTLETKENKETKEKTIRYKDGFHIYYDIPLSCNKRLFFFDKIKSKIENENLFGDIDQMSSYDEIVDESVMISNGMLMFGSQKEGRNPYELTYVYNSEIEKEPIEDYKNPDDLISLFSLQQYNDDDDTEFVEKYLSEEKSINDNVYSREDRKNKKDKKSSHKDPNDNNSIDIIQSKYAPGGSFSLNNFPDEYKGVLDLVNMLSVKRATEFHPWIRVCWALHGISPRLYNLFVHFSRKAPNFDESGCYRAWSKANRDGAKLTISSLKIWAKEDNPEMFKQIYYRKLRELAMKIENPNHDDIANIIVAMYNDIYKCANIKNNSWYEYQNHRWVSVDSAYTLQERIASEVSKELFKINEFLWTDATDKKDAHRDDSIKQIKKLCDTVLKLKDQNYGTTLIKTCARKFYDPKFEESLDANPYLIGFENGVYDLKAMSFRPGMTDDRLTMSTHYDYHEFSENDDDIKKINAFIKKIQPKDHIRDYVLRLFSSCLDGKNKDQQFRIFTGFGSNGKSKIIDLLTETLGQYAGSLPPEILTIRNNSPNGATPYLADKRGKRFLILQEPEGDSTIQVGKMKGLTGGDKVPARKLFGDPFEYTPQFKMILVCNKLPKIPSDDGGTWRRIRVTRFDSKFVKTFAEVNEDKHHYLADLSIDEERLKEWAPAFMWMLINIYYVKYMKPLEEGGGLNEPEEVREYTEKYRKESDVFFEFLKEMIDVTGNDNDSEKTVLLFSQFKDWHRDNYNHATKCARKDLEEYLEEKRGLRIEKGVVYGVRGAWDKLDSDDDEKDKEKEKEKKKKHN